MAFPFTEVGFLGGGFPVWCGAAERGVVETLTPGCEFLWVGAAFGEEAALGARGDETAPPGGRAESCAVCVLESPDDTQRPPTIQPASTTAAAPATQRTRNVIRARSGRCRFASGASTGVSSIGGLR